MDIYNTINASDIYEYVMYNQHKSGTSSFQLRCLKLFRSISCEAHSILMLALVESSGSRQHCLRIILVSKNIIYYFI